MKLQETLAEIDQVLAEAEAYGVSVCEQHGATEAETDELLAVYRAELAQKREEAVARLIAIHRRGGETLH